MVYLGRRATEMIRAFLASQSALGLNYSAARATRTAPPEGFDLDHNRIKLGDGEGVLTRARAALERWNQFRSAWVEAWSPERTIKAGTVVAVLAHTIGLWWLSACRIVCVVDEPGSLQRFGFAYGTLPDHAETGEESFLVVHFTINSGVRPDAACRRCVVI